MNKKKGIVLGVLAIVVFLVIFLSRNDGGFSLSSTPRTTSKTVEIEMMQEGYITSFVYSSDEGRVHIRFTPHINMALVTEDFSITPTSVEIVNAEFSSAPKIGTSLRLYPTTLLREESCLGNYYEGCDNPLSVDSLVDMGDSHVYNVVETPLTYGELPEYLGPLNFSIYVFDIGTYDHDAIMDRDGSFISTKMLEYSGVNLSDLDCTIEFDAVVKLNDGTQIVKHFKGVMNGESLDEMFYQGELVTD